MRRLRGRAAVVALLTAVLLSGCGGDDDPVAAAQDCGELADVVVARIQRILDDVAALEEEGAAPGATPTSIEGLDDLSRRVDERGQELGCSTEEGRRLVAERFDRLEAEGPVAQLLLDMITGSVDSSTGTPTDVPITTTPGSGTPTP